MTETLFIVLLAVIALLSKPGRITRTGVSGSQLSKVQSLIVQRGISSALMIPALFPLLVKRPFWTEINATSTTITLVIVLLVPILSFFIVRPDQNSEPHEIFTGLQAGSLQWGIYLLTTSVYMLFYEILLRGILLYFLMDWLGIILAIALNAVIYGAMHLTKDIREALLCVPLGVFLCWITLQTGSVWPAAVFHLVMALSFELFYNSKGTHVNV